jgi:sugar O-acyltransferase (sialic acid O-acetyltransferase NeuD family)
VNHEPYRDSRIGRLCTRSALVIDDINSAQPTWDFLGFVDPGSPQRKGQLLYDRPILGGFEDVADLPDNVFFACGIGAPAARRKECLTAEQLKWQPATLIHPSVIMAKHVEVGLGTVIGAGSIVAPYATIGRHCAINLQVTVGHNSQVADFCVLSPGARLSGNTTLEDEVFIGTNAIVYLGRRVGAGASLGANSFLVTNLAAGLSALGNPASSFGKATGAGICSTREDLATRRAEAKQS